MYRKVVEVRSCLELTAVVSLKRKLSLRESARCRRVRPSAGPFSNLNSFSLLLCSSVLYLLIVASVIGDWFPSVHTLKNIHTRVQPEAIRSCSPNVVHGRSTLHTRHPVHSAADPSRFRFSCPSCGCVLRSGSRREPERRNEHTLL